MIVSASFLQGDLGPSLHRCGACEHVISASTQEWHRLSVKQRRRFIQTNIAASFIVGLICVGIYYVVSCVLPGHPYSGNIALTVMAGASTLFLGLQGSRVFRSLERDGYGDIRPVMSSLWSFESNSWLMLVIPLIATIVFSLIITSMTGATIGTSQ